MLLRGEKVYLRPVEEKDLVLLVAWRNTPAIWQHFFNKFPLSMASQKSWFDRLISSDTKKLFMVCSMDQHEPAGTLGLDSIDFVNQRVEIGNVLIADPGRAGKGFASEAMKLLLQHCFNHLNMNRIYLEVFSENQRAIRLYEKCGFEKEGVLREAYFSAGKFQDILLMSLLRKDYARSGG